MKADEKFIKELFQKDLESSLSHIKMKPHIQKNILESLSHNKNENILKKILNYEIRINLSPSIGFLFIFIILIGSFTMNHIKLTSSEITNSQICPILLQDRR